MIEDTFQFAALILGLGISINTVYLIVRGHIARGRERRALIAELNLEFKTHLRLIRILSGKADRFKEENPTIGENAYDIVSENAKEALKTVTVRADQVLNAKPEWDLAKLAGHLTKKQFNLFVGFLDAYILYRERLDLRLDEFKDHPGKQGVKARFLSSAALSKNDKLDEKYSQFIKSVSTVKK